MYICHMTIAVDSSLTYSRIKKFCKTAKDYKVQLFLRGFYYYFVCDSGNFFN